MYQFRDPIHGFIEVSELEKTLIDSAPFQRLRNIRQLATTYLVYHGAEHTRFGHSLGVMHLVTKAFDVVISKNPELFDEHRREWYRQILRLIALIHDLGHAAFSHASEKLFEDGLEHEDYTKDILFNTEVADIIRKIGETFNESHNYDITPELLWLIYDGKDVMDENYIMPDFIFLKSFMDGALDCDKMDYLIRDSYFCGVKYGDYDIERLVSSFTAYQNADENILLLAVEYGGVHALEEFVLARYFMFIQVYFHKTRRFMDKRLVSCLENILPDRKYPVNILEYMDWDDTKVINEMKAHKGKSFSDNFLERNIMSCIYQTDIHANHSEVKRFSLIVRTLEKEIKRLGVDEKDLGNYVIVDEVSQPVHKISEGLKDKNDIPIMVEYQEKPETIYEKSLLLAALRQKPISINRIYVADKFKELAKEIIHG